MEIRVVTLRYQDAVQGFAEEALRQATFGRTVLDVREHFFVHGGIPHLSLVLSLADPSEGSSLPSYRMPNTRNPEELVPEASRPAFRALRQWRNARAKELGKPAYAVARNTLLAEIVCRVPQTLAALKEIEGAGEAFCRDYGKEILALIRDFPAVARPESLPFTPETGKEEGADKVGEGEEEKL